jgi:hypothetical protein
MPAELSALEWAIQYIEDVAAMSQPESITLHEAQKPDHGRPLVRRRGGHALRTAGVLHRDRVARPVCRLSDRAGSYGRLCRHIDPEVLETPAAD